MARVFGVATSISLAAVLLGCSQPAATGPAPDRASEAPAALDAAPDADPEPEAPPMTEIEARVLLSELFRDAGYRILYDRALEVGGAEVSADGWDPEREVGFEYIAPAEAELWSDAVSSPGEGPRLLVIAAGERDAVLRAAREFLASLPDQDGE